MSATDLYLYNNRPEIKYSGHGFDYMNGYSSTDLSDYYPYAENSKLVTLKEPSKFVIDNEKDMLILDGAEACYPVYSAIAKTVYKDIDKIENDFNSKNNPYTNGKIVTFTNTSIGYTFRYFLEGLNQEKDVKIISIDAIKPTTQNIKNQSYPISTYLYCVTLKANSKDNVKKLKDFLLSDQGQDIIEQTGYCSLK